VVLPEAQTLGPAHQLFFGVWDCDRFDPQPDRLVDRKCDIETAIDHPQPTGEAPIANSTRSAPDGLVSSLYSILEATHFLMVDPLGGTQAFDIRVNGCLVTNINYIPVVVSP
jgi:hypothetical protein